jgi:predicted nucleic acid-binding protein
LGEGLRGAPLLDQVSAGHHVVEDLRPLHYPRTRELHDRYVDVDIGFVDAAVMAVVEQINEPKLATLDHRHFRAFHTRHVDALQLVP